MCNDPEIVETLATAVLGIAFLAAIVIMVWINSRQGG